jgi:hypothetical protein
MTLILTPGERHQLSVAETLVEPGSVKGAGRGRPKGRPKPMVGDKGYGSRKFRRFLRQRGIGYSIPHKVNEHRAGAFDRQV